MKPSRAKRFFERVRLQEEKELGRTAEDSGLQLYSTEPSGAMGEESDKKKSKNNPWAICTASVGRKDKDKYERCVQDVKKGKKETAGSVSEGRDVPGQRDGTGPFRGSAQASISDVGMRKAAGEPCPFDGDDTPEGEAQEVEAAAQVAREVLAEFGLAGFEDMDWENLDEEMKEKCRDIARRFLAVIEPEEGPEVHEPVEEPSEEPIGEKAKLGSGARFKKLSKDIEKKSDVQDPDAVAASIGRKKYGKGKFQKMAAAGKESVDEGYEVVYKR